MFVGDSISYNQMQSLVCLLHAAAPDSNITAVKSSLYYNTTFQVNELARTINFYVLLFFS